MEVTAQPLWHWMALGWMDSGLTFRRKLVIRKAAPKDVFVKDLEQHGVVVLLRRYPPAADKTRWLVA